MVDDKEVDLEEHRIQKESEGLCMVPTDMSSMCNTTTPQWTNKTNTYIDNSTHSNAANTEQYQELQMNVDGENLRTLQETGKMSNYNGTSTRIGNLSTASCDSILTPNRADTNESNSDRPRLHLEQQLQGIFSF